MMSFNQIMRWSWAFLVAVTLSLGLGGCEGDDGAPGADGQSITGPQGDDGLACWDLNGNGVGDLPDEDLNNDGKVDVADCSAGAAKVTPLESCAVCHGAGAFADASANHALPPIETYSNVAFAVVDADLVVTFDVQADEVAATGYDTLERVYRTDGVTRTPILSDSTLANNGGGSYAITIAGGAAEAANDNRYLFRISIGADPETTLYLYGDFPASPVGPAAVSAAACTACHGPEGIDVHGGYFAAEDGGEPCLACHGPRAGKLFVRVHGYHSGIRTWRTPPQSIKITFPTYMSNCSVCHSEEAQLTAANAMSVSGEHCFSCHVSMENPSWKFPDSLDFHLNFPDPATHDCQQCHTSPENGGFAPATVAEFHNGKFENCGTDLEDDDVRACFEDKNATISEDSRLFGEPLLDNDGVLWNGEDSSVTEGKKFDWQITNVADDGANLAVTWQASYDGAPVNVCNDTVAAGEPVFHVGRRAGDIRIYRNYAQGDDFILGRPTRGPGQPSTDVDVTVENTDCVDGVATTTMPVEVDATVAKVGRLALNGKPLVVSPAPDIMPTMVARAKTPTYDWLVGIGGPAPDRRYVVDSGKCVGCHVGSLYQHGGDRVDNVNTCLVCHNAAANEKYVRVGMGVDASEAYDSKVGEAFELKTMIHRIHSVNHDWDPRDPDPGWPESGSENVKYNPPYLVYRGRGIYAFSNDELDLPDSWPGTGEQVVFGSDFDNDGEPGPYVINHNFHSATFPRSLNECTACHVEGFAVIPDQTKAMASTTDPGSSANWENQHDDTLQGAAATACVTCHADGPTKGHAYQNSWTPQVFPEGRQTIIDAVN